MGVIAVTALCIYAVYLYALIKLIPITLTLPGIAGLILTIGVAADANIVIFERVKEEIRHGRSISARHRAGLQEGLRDDRRRERRHAARRVHPLHPRHGRGQGLRVRARRRHDGLALHRRARDAGDPALDARLAAAAEAVGARRRASRSSRSRSTSWARRGGSSRCPGVILLVCTLAIAGNGLNFGIDFESGTRITAALERPATVEEVRERDRPRPASATRRSRRSSNEELGDNVVQIAAEQSGAHATRSPTRSRSPSASSASPRSRDRPDLRRVRRQLRRCTRSSRR